MPPRKTTFTADQYYHIYNRGINKQDIFQNDENFLFATRLIKRYAQDFSLSIIAYCLMPNHYHLLIRQDTEISAGLLPQRVFNSYTKAFNNHFQRKGTLFEGRFKSLHITQTSHLLQLCRYIHANPYKAHLVNNLEDWPYSNFPEWIGKRQKNPFDRTFIIDNFNSGDRYKEFVLEALTEQENNNIITDH